MTVTIEREQELVDWLWDDENSSGTHLVLPDYPDGKIIVTRRDALGVRRIYLHRQLYRRIFGIRIPANYFLLKTCDVVGCIHPQHYEMSRKSKRSTGVCRNGHKYRLADLQPDGVWKCSQCKEVRDAKNPRRGGKRRWEIELARQFCPQSHPYTPDNTYYYTTRSGGVGRKCKCCTLARARGLDPATISYP